MTPPTPTLFIPDFAANTGDINNNQRRVLICGDSGQGKTFQSLMTAPNPQLLDFDNSIADPRLVALKAPQLRFFDPEWCEKKLKKTVISNALLEYLKTSGMKYAKDQTPIVDSLSTLNDAVQDYYWKLVILKTQGSNEPDGRAFWGMVKDYYIDLFTAIKSLPCNFIMTAHLGEIRSKENGMFMNYAPLLDGSFRQRIGQFFTDVVRIRVTSKDLGADKFETKYEWQIRPDTQFPMAKSRSTIDKKYISADFKVLMNS